MSLIEVKKKLLMAQKGGLDVSDVFNTSIWTGTGAARTITTGIDSSEGSLVWIKARNIGASNQLFDTVRGAGNALSSDMPGAQDSGGLTAFTSSGYSLNTSGSVNSSTRTYVGWQFRRAEKFFDIVQYTGNGASGRQIAHNLGIAPGLIIVKQVNQSRDWAVYAQSVGASSYGALNLENAFFSGAGYWNNTSPTSDTFTVGNSLDTNQSGGTYIAYLFAHDPSPEGFIQCGSYVGNGSATGPVVTLGWRPQYLMIKNAVATGSWSIIDSSRGFTAADDAILLANTTGTESSANRVNPNSTGFQLASGAIGFNSNNQTYIYMAIREAV